MTEKQWAVWDKRTKKNLGTYSVEDAETAVLMAQKDHPNCQLADLAAILVPIGKSSIPK